MSVQSQSPVKHIWDKFSDRFGQSVLHPQYMIKKHAARAIREAEKRAHGALIDIGCGRMPYRDRLEPQVKSYTGVGHPAAAKLYEILQ